MFYWTTFFNTPLKYCIVFSNPCSRETFGSQLRIFLAFAISGFLCFGSSSGNSLKMIFELVPVNFNTRSANSRIVRSSGFRYSSDQNNQTSSGGIFPQFHRSHNKSFWSGSVPIYGKISPLRACPIKFGTTRPSFKRMRGPYVLKIRTILVSTP